MKANIFLGALKVKNKNVEWLVEEMSHSGVSISKSTIYKKLRGDSEFTAPEIKTISKIMGFTEKEMLDIFFAELVS